MNFEKYLPVGTVVLLKDGGKKVMITGFCCVTEDNKEKVWDYVGCLYPEGIISTKENCLFNHEQISKIFHLGYVDEDEKKFKSNLLSVINNEKYKN